MAEEKNKKILEAALFVSGGILSEAQLAELVPRGDVKTLMGELIRDYGGSAIEIVDLGGKYIMQVRQEYVDSVKNLAPKELANPILRTLSLIAYKQPITQADVVRARGSKAYDHIKELEERELIKSKKYGHTKLLETTKTFDEYFGLEGAPPLLEEKKEG